MTKQEAIEKINEQIGFIKENSVLIDNEIKKELTELQDEGSFFEDDFVRLNKLIKEKTEDIAKFLELQNRLTILNAID